MSELTFSPGSPARPSTSPADDLGGPGGARGRLPDVLGVLTWLSLLVVAALWVCGGGVRAVTSLGQALTSLGRLTGLLSANLLLIQVILMARVPMIERRHGQDGLTAIHRVVGFGSFTLLLAHLGLILFGYADASWTRLWDTITSVVLDLPGMVLALAGTLALTMVVLTSMARARARLRYESWHLLHLYAYLGCFLALPHQLWTGADFLASPWATAYWWGLWGAAAGAMVAFRVALPLVRSRRHALVVSAVTPAGAGVTTVTVTGRDLDRLPVRAGQFFNWRFLDGPGWTRANPYSLSAAPDGRTLQISVAAVGDGSSRAARLRPGTRVLVEGPYGRLHPGVRTRRAVTLIAGGIGVAPMKALVEALDQAPGEVSVIYRTADRHTAPLLAELVRSAAERGARLAVLDGPRAVGRASWLPRSWEHLSDADALAHLCPGIADQDVYVCGAPGWMDAVQAALTELGAPPERVHTERFCY